jgi:hypothetical protein
LDSFPLEDRVSANDALRRGGEDIEMQTAQIICGRGRVGKTVVANTIVQYCRERGADLRVWNADRQNETHSLNTFHADTARPPADDIEEKRLWLEARYDEQVRLRFDSLLDIAGGDPLVRHLANETKLIHTLERRLIRPVSWQILGPEVADLDYLKLSMEGGLFMPEATLLVLNAGLVRSGRSVKAAFADVTSHKVFVDAVAHGARVVCFPALSCMSSVVDRGLSFVEAKQGITKPGQERLSYFDQARIEIFWDEQIPEFFNAIPQDWLPALPGSKAAKRQVPVALAPVA